MLDLREEVTVFVATVGDAVNYRDCRKHLDRQDCTFRTEVVDRVAPAAAALQEMIARCRTPYYVQVDEDMLLHPHAVRTLHQSIVQAPSRAALACHPLWDEHIQQAILGVKIYKHAILRNFTYRADSPACEIDINGQLQRAGYELRCPWSGLFDKSTCLGLHGAHYTPASAYEAYFSRAVKSRLCPEQAGWVRRLPAVFLRLMRRQPRDPIHLYALLGYVAGLNVDLARCTVDKDFRIVDPAFVRIQQELKSLP